MADNNKGKKAGRPASYSADFFPHYSNHDGESHLRHIVRKWKAPGYMIYFNLLERLGSTQHHFIEYRTEEDKLDLHDQLRPADDKTIQEILDYLISRQVLDNNLYDQGIIYSPFFVNTLSTLYSSRHCKPKIPEIDNDGNITKQKDFPFSTEKYLFSTVNDLLQNDNAAKLREVKLIEVKKKELSISMASRQRDFITTVEKFIEENPKYQKVKDKFIDYWTAPNEDNTKFRREDQKHFSLKVRLDTFLSNENKSSKPKDDGIYREEGYVSKF